MPFELSLSGWDLVTYKVRIGTGFVARHFNKFDLKKNYMYVHSSDSIQHIEIERWTG